MPTCSNIRKTECKAQCLRLTIFTLFSPRPYTVFHWNSEQPGSFVSTGETTARDYAASLDLTQLAGSCALFRLFADELTDFEIAGSVAVLTTLGSSRNLI